MGEKAVFVTGAQGEIGRSLIPYLTQMGINKVIALDLSDQHISFPGNVDFLRGDILDIELLKKLSEKYSFDTIFHLAGILSSHGEKDPFQAHQVNVEGSLNILELARGQTQNQGRSVKLLFPSTIAVYGLTKEEKNSKTVEEEGLSPHTMYGVNKLYVENLGRYYSENFGALTQSAGKHRIDFRCVRLPGVLSADTLPTGGTSDYGPEMAHAAAQGKPYACFVSPEATLPFMAMPDAVRSLLLLSQADPSKLTRRIYNVGSFSIRADAIKDRVVAKFPNAKITFEPDPRRLSIVESWPADVDDSDARNDWGWKPEYDLERTFNDYLFPGVLKHYAKAA